MTSNYRRNRVSVSIIENSIIPIGAFSNSDLIEEMDPISNWILTTPAIILMIWIGITFFLYIRYNLYPAVDYLEVLVSIMIL